MNIAIIGNGTASIITAMQALKHGHSVSVFHDPDKPFIKVGESTTPHFGALIYDVTGYTISDLMQEGLASLKIGVHFMNWSEKNFFHPFHTNQSAFHFDTTTFNPFMWDILSKTHKVKIIPEKVSSIEESDTIVQVNSYPFDFVVHCVGWQKTNDMLAPMFETVNSAILYKKQLNNNSVYTEHKAHENGWQFGLPFPNRGEIRHGYLYNSKHTKESDLPDFGPDAKKISWEPKVCRHISPSPRQAFNGNRLFFVEPLQALSAMYYVFFAENIMAYLNNPTHENHVNLNNLYVQDVLGMEAGLAFHYQYCTINSKFWNDARERAKTIMRASLNFDQQQHAKNTKIDQKFGTSLAKVGPFDHRDMPYLLNGFTCQTMV